LGKGEPAALFSGSVVVFTSSPRRNGVSKQGRSSI
jgi:hypothetical protein